MKKPVPRKVTKVPPRVCPDFYTSDLHRVEDCSACQKLKKGER